jgi:hypothetical protein
MTLVTGTTGTVSRQMVSNSSPGLALACQSATSWWYARSA